MHTYTQADTNAALCYSYSAPQQLYFLDNALACMYAAALHIPLSATAQYWDSVVAACAAADVEVHSDTYVASADAELFYSAACVLHALPQ